MPRPLVMLFALLLAFPFVGACRAPQALPPPPPGDVAAVDAVLEALYASFAFEAGGEADWEAMEALFLEGAAFVAPIRAGQTPRAVDARRFVANFREWVRTSPEVASGLHERILGRRIELFGHIAQAWVAFEGFVPATGRAQTRGLDAIQLVRSPAGWRLVSFTTHYASPSEPLPARFLGAAEPSLAP